MSEKITVPTLGESVTEATVSKWLKSQGDKVIADEPVVELETDKVNVEVPAPTNGILGNIAVKEGETVNVGSLLGTINNISSKGENNPDEIKNYNPPKKKSAKEPKLFEDEKIPTPKMFFDQKKTRPIFCSADFFWFQSEIFPAEKVHILIFPVFRPGRPQITLGTSPIPPKNFPKPTLERPQTSIHLGFSDPRPTLTLGFVTDLTLT